MAKVQKPEDLKETKSLMQALLGMKPKPHEDMKLKKRKSARPEAQRKKTKAAKRGT